MFTLSTIKNYNGNSRIFIQNSAGETVTSMELHYCVDDISDAYEKSESGYSEWCYDQAEKALRNEPKATEQDIKALGEQIALKLPNYVKYKFIEAR